MATKRQITLAIVEGLSDKTALEGILKKAFAPLNSETRVECVREDITSDKDVTPKNVVSRVTDVVKKYAARYGLQPKDFLRVIQLTDTDGAYIPDDAVTLPSGSIMVNPDPFYTPTAILTAHPDWIKERNQQKEKNINRLVSQNTVWRTIPYKLYYMSCNMEDAFHQRNNLTDNEKAELAVRFHEHYIIDIPGFYALLKSLLPPSLYRDYKSSWEYVKEDLHSLERGSNLFLAMPPDTSDDESPKTGSFNK